METSNHIIFCTTLLYYSAERAVARLNQSTVASLAMSVAVVVGVGADRSGQNTPERERDRDRDTIGSVAGG